MKKVLTIILAAGLIFALAACGGNNNNEPTGGGNQATPNTPNNNQASNNATQQGAQGLEATSIMTFGEVVTSATLVSDDGAGGRLYNLGASADEAMEKINLYRTYLIGLGYQEIDSGLYFSFNTAYGEIMIVGGRSGEDYNVATTFTSTERLAEREAARAAEEAEREAARIASAIEEAERFLEQGNWSGAFEAFTDLGMTERAQGVRYRQGEALLAEQDFAEAIMAFLEAGDYSGASEQIESIVAQHRDELLVMAMMGVLPQEVLDLLD